MRRVLVVNGPNLDKLGTRQPEIYGSTTLAELEKLIAGWAEGLGLDAECFQSNDEDAIVAKVAKASGDGVAGIVINPAALSHFSHPLRDALAATGLPIVEVHISNIHAREPFRRLSLVSGVAKGVIAGLGVGGYRMALEALAGIVRP
ncbi:MAG: type II 3-dehydroquinate dehydratase [Actinomycetota bacterium]